MRFLVLIVLRTLAKGRKGDNGEDEFTKVYPSMVEESIITIPISSSGNFDLETQKSIANKCKAIEQIKLSIEQELEKIEKMVVDI